MKEVKYITSPHGWHGYEWSQNQQGKDKKKLSQDNLSLRRFSQKWVREKRGKSTGGSKNPCLSCLSLAQCKPTFMIFPQWGRRVWKQRNEIWVFLNYFKYEITLEDISKENCGKKKQCPFIKLSSFSQTGIAVVNLTCLTNSLGHPESVKPAFGLSLDNQATMGHKKITWAPGSCPWGWLVARAEILVLGGLADSTCCTPSDTASCCVHVPQESRRQDESYCQCSQSVQQQNI